MQFRLCHLSVAGRVLTHGISRRKKEPLKTRSFLFLFPQCGRVYFKHTCQKIIISMMAAEDIPKVSATLRLEPPIYSISSEPSTLHLEVTSHHHSPITILADNLSVHWMLYNGTAFIITDLASNRVVEQIKRVPTRTPLPSRFSVPVLDWQLYTLYPEEPLLLTGPFFLHFKQLPEKGPEMERDWVSIMGGSPSSAQPLLLEHRYMISLSGDEYMRWDKIRWWEYGTKEELLKRGLDGREVTYGAGPHGSISVDTSQIEPIVFKCTE
ncbi:hypothetical protein F5Y14DRAFT_436163 [Nemania sp. NC0429]|nr:hypothetical protein F5Y14DRAFT_436163 [Nemania sp. NC0429]